MISFHKRIAQKTRRVSHRGPCPAIQSNKQRRQTSQTSGNASGQRFTFHGSVKKQRQRLQDVNSSCAPQTIACHTMTGHGDTRCATQGAYRGIERLLEIGVDTLLAGCVPIRGQQLCGSTETVWAGHRGNSRALADEGRKK